MTIMKCVVCYRMITQKLKNESWDRFSRRIYHEKCSYTWLFDKNYRASRDVITQEYFKRTRGKQG